MLRAFSFISGKFSEKSNDRMGKGFRSLGCILSLLLVSATANQDVIHLDLAPLRNLTGETDTNPAPSTIEEGPDIPTKNDHKIYCTDSTFPNDIFCHVSALNRAEFLRLQPVTTKFYLEYPHPARSQSQCFVSFKNTDDSSPSRLEYKSFSCYDSPDSNSTARWLSDVEWDIEHGVIADVPDSSLPETLKVEDVAALEIEDSSTVNVPFKCKRRFKKAEGGVSGPPSTVTFDRDTIACISSAPPLLLPERQHHLRQEVVPEA